MTFVAGSRRTNSEIIRWWAEDFLTKNDPVKTGAHAPASKMKADMVDELRSDGERIAYDLGSIAKEKETKIVLAVEDVRDLVVNRRKLDRSDPRMKSSLTLRKALVASGLVEPHLLKGRLTAVLYQTRMQK